MANYISENDIEKACCEIIMGELGYDQPLNLWQVPDDGNAVFGRADSREVVRRETLLAALVKLNPKAPESVIDSAFAPVDGTDKIFKRALKEE